MSTTPYRRYPYGHDFGNSDTDGMVYVGSDVRELSMPSALYEGSYEELSSKANGESLYQLGVITPQSHIIKLKGYEFYVGELAIEQAPSVEIAALTSRGDISRYWSHKSLAMLLATSGTLIRDREYGLTVVTGLPVLTISEEYIQAITRALSGTHEFVLDGMPRIAHVSVQKVIMEGSGANIAHGRVGAVKVATIDIGGRTTDLNMNRGLIPIVDQCQSIDVGIETAIDNFTEAFYKQFNYPLTTSDATKIQHAYIGKKDYGAIPTVRNAKADPEIVDALMSKAIHDVGLRIASAIKRIWASSLRSDVVASDTEEVLLIGGGAYYLEDIIRGIFFERLIVPEDPQCANAAGYLRLAHRILNKAMKDAV